MLSSNLNTTLTCSKSPEILSGEQEFFTILVLSVKTNMILLKQEFENKCPLEMYKQAKNNGLVFY
jgi:hypothetical protein